MTKKREKRAAVVASIDVAGEVNQLVNTLLNVRSSRQMPRPQLQLPADATDKILRYESTWTATLTRHDQLERLQRRRKAKRAAASHGQSGSRA